MTIAQENVERFASRTPAEGLNSHVDEVITQAINTAAAHYRAGQPGRGEFVLRRLEQRLMRLERPSEVPQ